MQPGEMDALLQQAVRAMAESFEALTSPDTFDILCSFLKCVDAVPGISMNKLLDVIMSGFAAEVDAAAHDIDHEDQQTCAAHKVPMEMYAFLLNWSARSVEKVNVPDEDASAAAAPANRMVMERPDRAYSYVDRRGFKVEDLQDLDLLQAPLRECLNVLLKEFDHAQLGEEILREIAAKSFNAQDTKGPTNFSRFLTQFAEWAPRAVLKQISLLLSHLGSESYPMRMAIVEIIGCLIREFACSEDLTSDTHQTQKQLNSLYDLLLEHTLNLFSYVRSKVFTVLSRLCDLPVKFPKLHLVITRAAASALEDRRLARDGGVGRSASGDDFYGSAREEAIAVNAVPSNNEFVADLSLNRRRNKDTEDAMDVDEQDGDEGGDSDEVDSIMDEDELESSRAEEGSESASTWTVTHRPVPSAAEEQVSSAVPDADAMDEDPPPSARALISTVPRSTQGALTGNAAKKSDDTGDAFELSQLLFVVGHVTVKHIVYLELVEREWKCQKQENELAEKLARGTGNDAASKGGEELDQVAGNARDEARHQSKYFGQNATLRVATLSFSMFLCLSSQFCDANHHLLFRILETSRNQSNIAIALGDVAVSFNTIVDENSDELYWGLSDKDLVVKKNTLMVLTHLMSKFKGQLGDVSNAYTFSWLFASFF
ncbi:hypothetical protein BGW80DRAFT_1465730 [Lactifluus volemus]|nr:hypothetical protein BGW80DRAFT_1465730 [Lactifluus volemus]